MKLLFVLSILGLALSVSTQVSMEKPKDDSALINELTDKFDGLVQEALANVYFAASDRLQSDIAAVKEKLEENEEVVDSDETEVKTEEEDWSEPLVSDVGDTLLQSLADAGKQLSDEFKKSLQEFSDREAERAASRAFLRALGGNK